MKKLLLILPALLLLTACGGSKANDCEKACANVPAESQSICMSTCEKAAKQYDAQGSAKNDTSSNGPKNDRCEGFSAGMVRNSCYFNLAMDEKNPSYCDNIGNSAERSECKDNAQ